MYAHTAYVEFLLQFKSFIRNSCVGAEGRGSRDWILMRYTCMPIVGHETVRRRVFSECVSKHAASCEVRDTNIPVYCIISLSAACIT